MQTAYVFDAAKKQYGFYMATKIMDSSFDFL